MADELIKTPPPLKRELDLIERLAQALWEVVPYDRVLAWDEASDRQKYHYRARAARLLEDFDIEVRGWRPETPPVRNMDETTPDEITSDMTIYGHALIRLTKPSPDWAGMIYNDTAFVDLDRS